jgi:hypothetical protein
MSIGRGLRKERRNETEGICLVKTRVIFKILKEEVDNQWSE